MSFLEGQPLLNIVFAVVAIILGWVLLRAVLRLTLRLFAVGCLVISAVAVIAGVVSWLA